MEMNLGKTFFLNQIFEKFLTLLSKRRAGERSVEGSRPKSCLTSGQVTFSDKTCNHSSSDIRASFTDC